MAGIEQTIEQLTRTRINEQAVNIERTYFYKTDKKVDPRRENPFKLFPGSIPVLVSAPHAVRHFRHKKIKMSDQYTGAIAALLNQLTGCHALTVTKLYGGDPNIDSNCLYKDLLASVCKQHRIKFVLDLHGASGEHPFDVDLGTMDGESLLGQSCWLTLLRENLNHAGITAISESFFPAKGVNTITNFTSRELLIPALQLEINRRYRVPAQNAAGFTRLIATLSRFISLIAADRGLVPATNR